LLDLLNFEKELKNENFVPIRLDDLNASSSLNHLLLSLDAFSGSQYRRRNAARSDSGAFTFMIQTPIRNHAMKDFP